MSSTQQQHLTEEVNQIREKLEKAESRLVQAEAKQNSSLSAVFLKLVNQYRGELEYAKRELQNLAAKPTTTPARVNVEVKVQPLLRVVSQFQPIGNSSHRELMEISSSEPDEEDSLADQRESEEDEEQQEEKKAKELFWKVVWNGDIDHPDELAETEDADFVKTKCQDYFKAGAEAAAKEDHVGKTEAYFTLAEKNATLAVQYWERNHRRSAPVSSVSDIKDENAPHATLTTLPQQESVQEGQLEKDIEHTKARLEKAEARLVEAEANNNSTLVQVFLNIVNQCIAELNAKRTLQPLLLARIAKGQVEPITCQEVKGIEEKLAKAASRLIQAEAKQNSSLSAVFLKLVNQYMAELEKAKRASQNLFLKPDEVKVESTLHVAPQPAIEQRRMKQKRNRDSDGDADHLPEAGTTSPDESGGA